MKPLFWMGSSLDDLRDCPDGVQDNVGYALHIAQTGGKHRRAKPLRGYRGASVLEVVDDFEGDTYRAVYTVQFAQAVYVLHVFQKKSTRGIATSRRDLTLIDQRLDQAEDHYAWWSEDLRRK
jgi:phage-related protein